MTKRNYIQNKVATSSFTLPVAAVITILSWCCSEHIWSTRIIHCLLVFACTYLLIILDTTYSLIRTRSRIGPALFLLCMAIMIPGCTILEVCLALPFVLSLYMLLNTQQEERSHLPIRSFQTFLFLSISILIHPVVIILLFPYIVAMGTFLRAWTLRSAIAAILGLLTPFWFLFGWYLITWDTQIPIRIFDLLQNTEILNWPKLFNTLSWEKWTLIILIIFIGICSITHYLRTKNYDKVHTRMLLNTLVLIEICLIIGIIILPLYMIELQIMIFTVTSILAGHYFTLDHSKTTRIIFIITIICFFILIIQNIWNNLFH